MKCKECKIEFRSDSQFFKHFSKVHTKSGITKYVCPHDCDRIYSSYSSFKHHILWHKKQQTAPVHHGIIQEYVFTELDDVFRNDHTTAGNEDEEEDDFPFYEGVAISEEYGVSMVRP